MESVRPNPIGVPPECKFQKRNIYTRRQVNNILLVCRLTGLKDAAAGGRLSQQSDDQLV